tara:strand:- start:302 stop:577 length:276 start_codon:yes stop_codon:yes gene_type:complete
MLVVVDVIPLIVVGIPPTDGGVIVPPFSGSMLEPPVVYWYPVEYEYERIISRVSEELVLRLMLFPAEKFGITGIAKEGVGSNTNSINTLFI